MEQEIKILNNASIIVKGGVEALGLYTEVTKETYSLCSDINKLEKQLSEKEQQYKDNCNGIVVEAIDKVLNMFQEEVKGVTEEEFDILNNIIKRINQQIKDVKKEYSPKLIEKQK